MQANENEASIEAASEAIEIAEKAKNNNTNAVLVRTIFNRNLCF